jgi:hypothetical protein
MITSPAHGIGFLTASLLLAGCCGGRTRCAPACPPTWTASPAPAAAPAPAPVARAVAPERHVFLEATIYRIPAARAEELLGANRGGSSRAMELLSPADVATLEERLAKDKGVSVLQQPAILAKSGDEATIWTGESYDGEHHRMVADESHAAALADGSWSGTELRLLPTLLPGNGGLSLDLAFIHREPPPEGTTPDAKALVAHQLHAKMGVAKMASGDSAAILVAAGEPNSLGERMLLVTTPRIVPATPTPSSK